MGKKKRGAATRRKPLGPPEGIKKKSHREPLGNKHKIVSPAIVENYEIEGPQPVTTVQTQELLQVATANTLTEDLDSLYDCLHGKDANYTVVSSKCAAGAVCWNWVFFGGQTDFAEDPSWAYLYVQSNLTTLNKLGVTDNVKRLLDDAKKEISGRSPNRIPAVKEEAAHKLILLALLNYYWIPVQEESRLKLLFYYKKGRGIMYHHVEFEYRGEITITKGNNEDLKAFNGESGLTMPGENFEETYGKIIFGINIDNLKRGHSICIKDLRVRAEAART